MCGYALGRATSVKLLITAGSQAPFFYEIGALSKLPYPEQLRADFPPWLNIYDPQDLLSYVGKDVFAGRVEDVPVNNGLTFPWSHTSYFDNPGDVEDHSSKVALMGGIRAVVVGVEKYGAAWNLNGPACDAVRFVGWLAGNGVPAANISLFVSALPENQAAVDGCHVTARPATSHDIVREFTDVLAKVHDDLLIVFWGGHGVIRADGARLLLTAEATENNVANIDLNSLLESLRSDLFAGFRRQIVLVDACANYLEHLRRTIGIPSTTLPAGSPVPARQQFVVVSAKAGEAARNLDAERTGLFSKQLREALADAGFPPDMEKVARTLQRRFADLRDRSEARQTPVYFWYRDWETNEAGLGSPASGEVQRPRSAFKVSIQSRNRLVDAFCGLPGFMNSEERNRLMAQISPSIVAVIARHSKPRFDIDAIVGTCLSFPKGICELLDAVRFFYRDAESLGNLEVLMERVLPGECGPASGV